MKPSEELNIKKLIDEAKLLTEYFVKKSLTLEESQSILTLTLIIYILTRVKLEADSDKISHLWSNLNDVLINTIKTYLNESN